MLRPGEKVHRRQGSGYADWYWRSGCQSGPVHELGHYSLDGNDDAGQAGMTVLKNLLSTRFPLSSCIV